jgi:predicted DCC family thiol-disulfide oxidoreductase YuxK
MATGSVKLLYDGACPFCGREVAWLQRRDRSGNLAIEDISDPAFDPAKYGLTGEQVARVLHAILPGGRVLRGVDAVCAAYQAVGLGWVVAPVRWPVIHGVASVLYGAFARHRAGLGRLFGRGCEHGTCTVKDMPRSRSAMVIPKPPVCDRQPNPLRKRTGW